MACAPVWVDSRLALVSGRSVRVTLDAGGAGTHTFAARPRIRPSQYSCASAVSGFTVFNSRLRHREIAESPAWMAEPIEAGSSVTPGMCSAAIFTNATYRIGSGHSPR